MESEDPKVMRSTRHQIMQRKKRMEELLRSAYSSAKDHLSHFPHYNTNGFLAFSNLIISSLQLHYLILSFSFFNITYIIIVRVKFPNPRFYLYNVTQII
ncbi:hypothetical protein Hanom_Chr15g01408241 [Helianthus anomalus]